MKHVCLNLGYNVKRSVKTKKHWKSQCFFNPVAGTGIELVTSGL